MIRLVVTEHLVYHTVSGAIFSRFGCAMHPMGYMLYGQFLGTLEDPQVFITDLNIIAEWQVLQDFVSAARR